MTTTPTLWKALSQVNVTDAPGPGANAAGTSEQSHPGVVALTGGRYLVSYVDGSTNFSGLEPHDILGQIFDALGNRIGGEIYLSSVYQDGDQPIASIAALSTGGFVVAYESQDAAMAGDLQNIDVQVFDSTGGYVRNDDFRQGFAGPAGVNDTNPAIATFADDSYVVVYETDASGASKLTATVVSAAGVMGIAFEPEASPSSAINPDVVVLGNGNIAIAYEDGAGGNHSVRVAIRTPAAGVVADTLVAVAGGDAHPDIATLAGGGFVVAFAATGGDANIRYAVFDDAGVNTFGTTFPANLTTTAGDQDTPSVVALADGGFVIAWRDAASGAIEAQRFTSAGVENGEEVTLASLDSLADPTLAILSDGRFLVAATNTNGGGNADVFSAIWDPRTGPITGSDDPDVLTSRVEGATVLGLKGDDTLYGRPGASDTLSGGEDDDTYFVDDSGDVVVEAAGQGALDIVMTSASYALAAGVQVERLQTLDDSGLAALNLTGNEFVQTIIGNNGVNRLDGKAGADTMQGRGGNDVYVVDNAGDVIIEGVGGGSLDLASTSVSYALGAGVQVEQLQTTNGAGTGALNLNGNEFAQAIIGNDGVNRLDGKGGADTMQGRGGNDTYIVDNAGDVIVEGAGQGTADSVATGVSYALGAAAQVELLQTTDGSGLGAINLTGNAFAQRIDGNNGVNRIDGRAGADTMVGRGGNDTYLVDNAGDVVVEGAGQGALDIVATSVGYALAAAAQVEQLQTIDGSSAVGFNLYGNAFGQTIIGNNGANSISGKAGNDVLQGRGGADTFVFDTALGAGNIDRIVDFSVADDTIRVNHAIFAGLATGVLAANAFVIGAAATDAFDRIVYDSATGALSFDDDGNGAHAAIQFATLSTGLNTMTNADFFVV